MHAGDPAPWLIKSGENDRASNSILSRLRLSVLRRDGRNNSGHADSAIRVAERQVPPGALNDKYFIPVGKYHDLKILPAVTLTLLFLGLFAAHHILDTLKNLYWPILPVWLLAATVTAFQWIVSW